MIIIAHLEPYLSAAQLKHNYREATHPIKARRWQLPCLIALSSTIKEAAVVVGINYDHAREIVNSYNQQEETAIYLKKQPQENVPAMPYLTQSN